ncbi:MAG: hypothetical protein KGS72_27080 [Cyanobacteria bacterium REEB67]|nr:hypothetical protein [Cyanobacteria bacterium REEB67]
MAESKPYPWIISPFIDIFFVCGGAVFLCFAVNYLFLGWRVPESVSSDPASWWLLTVIMLVNYVFADSHNTATYLRIWGSEEDRSRFKFYRTWLVYSALLLFAVGILVPAFIGVLVYLYAITVFWHYAAQCFGISLIYCYKRDYVMNRFEKESFRWFIYGMVGIVSARTFCFKSASPSVFFGVPMPFWGPWPIEIYDLARGLFIASAILFVLTLLGKYFRSKQLFPWQAVLILAALLTLALSRDAAKAIYILFVPGLFHGSQYLAVCLSYYLKERGLPEGMSSAEIAKVALGTPGLKYLGIVILSGMFFYVGVPHFFSQIGFNFASISGLVLACVNYHHFVTDAAIWRLKDPRCRNILIA